MKSLQLNLTIADKEQIRRSWAFAIDPAFASESRVDTSKTRRKSLRNINPASEDGSRINRCVITAVSREAKAFGVRAGMVTADARLLMPELKVFVCNWS